MISGVFGADTALKKKRWKSAGGTHVVIPAVWDRLQPVAGGPLDPAQVQILLGQFTDAAAVGLWVIFEACLQYPPVWVKKAVPQFTDAHGGAWASTPGADVRDLVWSTAGQAYAADFIGKLFAAMAAVLWQVWTVRVGGGPNGELSFPAGGWWGYSKAAQSSCPLPGYVPFTGGNNDQQWTSWYLDSLTGWMRTLIGAHRNAGWDGSIHVLHPGFGLRENMMFGGSPWQAQAQAGVDWARQITAYPDANVWPWSTWADAAHPVEAPIVDSDYAAWWKLHNLAVAAGRDRWLMGENTGGQSNADLDRVRSSAGALGNGYAGLVWLDYNSLAGGGGASLAHLACA